MTLNTYVAGNPGQARSYAQELRKLGGGTETTATGAHRARTTAEGEWDGPASDAFQGWAKQQGTDGDALAEVYPAAARAHDVLADELDTVQARMEQAKQVARDGGLKLMGAHLILPPKAPTMSKPEPPQGRMNAAQSEQHSQDVAAYEAAMAEQQRQQAAWQEAKTTVTGAREKEKAAHETFTNALDKVKAQLQGIGQAGKWAQAGVQPASAAAGGLAQAATAMESSSAAATKSMFESSIGNPAAVNAAWSSMSSAQRADLIDRYPQMIGSTNGVPAVARDQANRSRLGAQRAQLVNELRTMNRQIREGDAEGVVLSRQMQRRHELEQALSGLDSLEHSLSGDKYLLGIDSTADSRGQVIVAQGNPDHADNTMTTVPGTFSDLGNVGDYVSNNETMLDQADSMSEPGTKNSAIVWADYRSPVNLGEATLGISASQGHEDLSQFQEGLRATHEGEQPSNNTLLGHSYGTTVIGEASQNGGSHADNLVFLGSPGVNADHASQLDVPPENVWGGRSDSDPIQYGRFPSPIHGVQDLITGESHLRFGMDPSNPHFGANTLPTDPSGGHSDYWNKDRSVDSMARVMTGNQNGGGAQ